VPPRYGVAHRGNLCCEVVFFILFYFIYIYICPLTEAEAVCLADWMFPSLLRIVHWN